MKKRIAFILSLMLCLLPVTALAADSTGSTEVSYTVAQTESTFEINIPSLIYLQSEDTISLRSTALNLKAGEKVVAYIDGSKSFSSGKLCLTSNGGSVIYASVYRLTKAKDRFSFSR